MFHNKEKVIFVILSLVFLIGAGCEQEKIEKLITDIGECENIPNLHKRGECLDDFYLQQALDNDDSSICNLITDPAVRESCEAAFVIGFEESVVENALADASLCDELEQELRQDCLDDYYFNQVIETDDLGFCNQINDGELRKVCQELE